MAQENSAPTASIADVAIAGAGPAGSMAARHLAQAGCRVVMLDRLRPAPARLGETLPGAARRLLVRNGLGGLASASVSHAPVIGGLVVWGDDRPVATDAMRDPYGPGLRLDRVRFDADMRQASLEAGACWSQTDVRGLERRGDVWVIHRDAAPPVHSRVIIDATGRSARLLRLLNQPRRRNAPLVALYQTAKPEKNSMMERTLIEATPDGWIYAGKLGDNRWVVGYHTQPENAVRLRSSATLRARILAGAPHLKTCLGDLVWEGPLLSRDARSLSSVTACGPGWFAIGDAAIAFDPIAGQGLFNALRTGLAAAEAILDGSNTRTIAYSEELKRVADIYAERRQILYKAEGRWSDHSFWRAQRFGGTI